MNDQPSSPPSSLLEEPNGPRPQSLDRFRWQAALLEQAVDAMLFWRLDGTIVYWSQGAERLYGYPAEQALDRPVHELLETSFPRSLEDCLELLRCQRTWEGELVHRTKDGLLLTVDSRMILEADGSTPLVLEANRDISQKKLAERRLRDSEAQYRSLVQLSPEAIWVNLQNRITFINDAGLKLLGATDPSQVLGRSPLEFLHPDCHETVMGRIDTMLATRAPVSLVEERVVRLDGAIVDVEVAAAPFDMHGQTAIQVMLRDVSARKQAEAALHRNEAHLRAIFDTEPECVKLLAADGALLEMNRAGLQMIGAESLEQVQNHCVLDLVAQEHRAAFADFNRRVFAGESAAMEFEIVGLHGRRLWVETHAGPLRDASGRVIAALGVTRDVTERKKADASLRESEERLRMALDAAHMGIFDWDVASDRITWSRGHEELWGYAPGEFDGAFSSFSSRIHPEDLPGIHKEIARCLAERDVYTQEYRVVWPDGSVHWVGGVGKFEFNSLGQPVRMRGVVMDTTARKRAEQLLAENSVLALLNADVGLALSRSADLRSMLRDCASSIVDRLGLAFARIWTLNRAAEVLELQASIGELDTIQGPYSRIPVGQTIIGWIARERRHFLTNDAQNDQRISDRPWVMEQGFQSFVGFPLLVENRLVGVLAAFGRRTIPPSQQEALAAIADTIAVGIERQRSQALLASVLNSVADGIVCLDDSGAIQWFNSAAEQLFGYTESELLGRSASLLSPRLAPERLADSSRRQARGGADAPTEARRKDGGAFPVQLSLSEFVLDGKTHLTAIVRDITRQLQLESQLHHAQKMEALGRLAGGVAHDFNNLLTVVSGYSEMLLSSLAHDDPKRDAARAISDAGARAASLTRQLLAFGRQTMLEPRVLDLNSIVADARKLLRRIIGEDIQLELSLDPQLACIQADPAQLGQVLINLAINARDAMPRGGVLSMETRNDECDFEGRGRSPCVLLVIRDTGLGMTPEVRARAFEPFFTTKGIGEGSGLGLAVVHGIVTQSGGAIDVRSEPGAGTEFSLRFPAVRERPSAAAVSPDQPGRGSETVLLAEDEEGVRSLALMVLTEQGYRVLPAANGREALLMAADHAAEIDILVTDVVMPGMGGVDLANLLTAQYPDMKVLFLSGHSNDAVLRHGIAMAEAAFLAKPFLPLDLARKVRQVLDGAQTQ